MLNMLAVLCRRQAAFRLSCIGFQEQVQDVPTVLADVLSIMGKVMPSIVGGDFVLCCVSDFVIHSLLFV